MGVYHAKASSQGASPGRVYAAGRLLCEIVIDLAETA
jgi:hypothetical protein